MLKSASQLKIRTLLALLYPNGLYYRQLQLLVHTIPISRPLLLLAFKFTF